MALNENIVREQDARISKMIHTPTFLVVAGALPALYAATSLENGVAIGIVTAVAILVMALVAPVLRAFTGVWSRSAVMLMLSVTVVTLLGYAVRMIDPVVFEALGIYLPLVAVNALVVAWIAGDGLVVARPRRRSPPPPSRPCACSRPSRSWASSTACSPPARSSVSPWASSPPRRSPPSASPRARCWCWRSWQCSCSPSSRCAPRALPPMRRCGRG